MVSCSLRGWRAYGLGPHDVQYELAVWGTLVRGFGGVKKHTST